MLLMSKGPPRVLKSSVHGKSNMYFEAPLKTKIRAHILRRMRKERMRVIQRVDMPMMSI